MPAKCELLVKSIPKGHYLEWRTGREGLCYSFGIDSSQIQRPRAVFITRAAFIRFVFFMSAGHYSKNVTKLESSLIKKKDFFKNYPS